MVIFNELRYFSGFENMYMNQKLQFYKKNPCYEMITELIIVFFGC